MTMIFLKFPDEATAIDAMPEYRDDDENGKQKWKKNGKGFALDVIGKIRKPSGVVLSGSDGDYPKLIDVDGWHMNLVGPLPDAAVPYVVEPVTPAVRFLGTVPPTIPE